MFQKHLLDFAKAEIETAIEPDGVSEDFGWETVAFVTDAEGFHQNRPIANVASGNLRWFTLQFRPEPRDFWVRCLILR
jgi:hypothetical protein